MRDGWVETTLGEVVAVNPEAAKDIAQDDEIIYVDIASVSAESGICTDLFRGNFGDAPGRARRVIRSNDVLVSTVRPYLKGFALVPGHLDGEIASTGFAVLRANPKKVLSGFVWALVGINSFVEYLMDRATGSSYPAVRPDDVASFEFNLPPLVEQRRIVDLVSSVDIYIDALQQQADVAREARNAVLHELLSAGGDDWTETTLGEIAEVNMGQSPPGSSYNSEGIGLPFIQGSAEFGEHSPTPLKWCSWPAKIAEIGDLLLSVRAPVGDTNIANQRIAIGRGLATIRGGNESNTGFLRLLVQKNTAELIANSGTGMFSSITGKNLKEFKILMPPLAEQKRIVETVSSIDEVIQATDKAVADAKKLRSGLLSDLLSGDHAIPESYDRLLGAA